MSPLNVIDSSSFFCFVLQSEINPSVFSFRYFLPLNSLYFSLWCCTSRSSSVLPALSLLDSCLSHSKKHRTHIRVRVDSRWLMRISIDLKVQHHKLMGDYFLYWLRAPPGKHIYPSCLFDILQQLCIKNVNTVRLLTIANDISSVYRRSRHWWMITSGFWHGKKG